MRDECVHGGANGGIGGAVVDPREKSVVFDHSRPSPVALTARFQADCTRTSYKPR